MLTMARTNCLIELNMRDLLILLVGPTKCSAQHLVTPDLLLLRAVFSLYMLSSYRQATHKYIEKDVDRI